MRVAFDATPLLGARTGIATFTGGLLAEFARHGRSLAVEPSAFALSLRGWRRLPTVLPPGVTAVRRPLPAGALSAAWARGDVPSYGSVTGGHRPEVVHGTNFVTPPNPGGGAVVTVYDLTSIRSPELVARSSLRYPAAIRAAVARGALVHVTAAAVADDVVELLGVDGDRVRVVASGPPPDSGHAGRPDRGRNIAGGPYVLALGTVEPRKGLPDLVRAFERLGLPDLRLVIAGPDGWGVDELVTAVDASPAKARIRRLGWVDDRTRADLLAGASAFCMPSRNEGFGYPPLEAMHAGVPVVATTAGSLPETVGDAGILVPPGDVDALAGALVAALTDTDRRTQLAQAGHAQVARFSWERCAREMAAVYRDALAAGRSRVR